MPLQDSWNQMQDPLRKSELQVILIGSLVEQTRLMTEIPSRKDKWTKLGKEGQSRQYRNALKSHKDPK